MKAVLYTEDMDVIRTPWVCYVTDTVHHVAGIIARSVADGEIPAPAYMEVQVLGSGDTVSLWTVDTKEVGPTHAMWADYYTTPVYSTASGRGKYGTRRHMNTVMRIV